MSDEREGQQGAAPEPTTMRLRAVEGAEPAEAPHESEHVLTKADLATVEALRPGTALLVVLRGPNTGARFLLDDDEVMSGRHPDSDIFLDDVTVSRRHAVLVHRDDGYYIDDEESLNGTYVNRRRVESAKLEDGDEVQIGKYRLTFLES